MATRRSQIQIEVLGLSDLQSLNTSLQTHERRLQSLTVAYVAFNSAMQASAAGTGRLASQFVTINNTTNNVNRSINTATNNIQNMGNAAGRTGGQMGGLLGTMLQYRAVSTVFEGVTRAITGTFEAMKEMEKQAARVQRVSAPGSTPGIRADFAVEAARTGAEVKDIGEAYYQLKTQIKDNTTAFSALQTAMNLVVGTESDARDTTRAMLQIYNQFGDSLDKTVGQAENMRRIGELLALTFKGADAELVDITAALKYLGPVAEAARTPLEQVTATISALTAEGHRGRMGGTEAAQFISNLIKNYSAELGGIEKKGVVYHFQQALTPQGGIDLVQTIRNIVDTANRLPTEKAREFLLAVSGTQNSFRFLGTSGPEFMRHLDDEVRKATAAIQGQTHEAEKLRATMNTTAQEFQRVWGGALSGVANMIDASGIRTFFRDIANDIERFNTTTRNMLGTNSRMGGILSGQGGFPGDPNAGRQQSRAQRATLQEMLDAAREGHLRGSVTTTEMLGGGVHVGGGGLYDAYRAKTAEERGFLQRFMRFAPTTGALAGPGVRDVTFDIPAMQAEFERLNQQLTSPSFGRQLTYGPANPFAGGRGVRKTGLDANGRPIITDKPEDAAKAANEAEKAAQEALDREARRLQTEFENAKQRFGEFDARTLAAGKLADAAAAKAGDADQRLRLKYGLTGNVADTLKNQDKFNEEQQEKARDAYEKLRDDMAKSARTDYDIAKQKHGLLAFPYGGATGAAAAAAQRAEEAAALASNDPDALRRLRAHITGTQGEFDSDRKEALKDWLGSFGSSFGSPSLSGIQNQYGQSITEAANDRLNALQRGARGNDIFRNQNAAEGGRLESAVQIITAAVAALAKITTPTQENVDQLKQMRDKLADANAALLDFKDRVAAQAYERRVRGEEDAYALKTEEINHLHRLRFSKDEEGASKDAVRKYQELIQAAQDHLDTVKGRPLTEHTPDEIRKAVKDVSEAQQNLADYKTDRSIQKYLNVYGNVKETVNSSLLNFLHGQGDLGTVAKNVGDKIVDAALESQIKRFTDPLIQTTTKQILSLQGNTDALDALNSTLNGQGTSTATGSLTNSPVAQSVAAGVQAGIDASAAGAQGGTSGAGGAAPRGRKAGQSDLEKGVGAGLAAYSIGATSAQQGLNAGNLLGGIVTGASIGATFGPAGALIGGAVGGVVDLIGSLFHHKDKPTATPQNLNPSLYNAPNAFDIGAYNYTMSGILPRMQDVGFDVKPTNAPIVIVNIDGVKQVVNREIGTQTSLGRVSLANSGGDYGMGPI